MARRATSGGSIDEILRSAMEPVLRRASASIAKAIADMAAEHVDAELQGAASRGRGRRPGKRGTAKVRGGRPSRGRTELTRWVSDRRARRVPNFVIEQTNGLDTKKKIVAKYGENILFELGKPPPKPKA